MMDPISAVGALAAVVQLAITAKKGAMKTRTIANAFHNAPAEIVQLAGRLHRLQVLLQELEKLGRGLSTADLDELFPHECGDSISGSLRSHIEGPERLQSLQTSSPGRAARAIRWAAVDKRSANPLPEEVKRAGAEADVAVSVLAARLGTVNYTSIMALKAGQDALKPTWESGLNELRGFIEVQVAGALA